jgi:UDP-glucuronate 4-epimerase
MYLVTGAAGFIGFNLCKELLLNRINVIGIDNMNDYYDPYLKKRRIDELIRISKEKETFFEICYEDIKNKKTIQKIFEKYSPSKVIHLAAQAGVRYSLKNPDEYIETNLNGFFNIIDNSRKYQIEHFVYASSSSVYGGNTNMPFSEINSVNHPISLYAATKKSNELIAHTYSHIYGLPTTGLRFFTVYGPWGRPDMALFLFTKAIIEGKPIEIFNNGEMIRDFTYIDDITISMLKIIEKIPMPDNKFNTDLPNPSTSWAPYKIFNIGNSKPNQLLDYVEEIENALGIKAIKKFLPMQIGDVPATESSCLALDSYIGFKPNTSIKLGIMQFIKWYKNFYNIN